MSSAWLSAAIQEFEQVTLDNGTELFRVRARAQREDDPEPRPVLETREHDGLMLVYEPLSSGGDRRGLLRLAYTVPTEHVGPSTTFALRLPDGYRIELPKPTVGDRVAELEDGQWPQEADPASADQVPQEMRSTRQSLVLALSELERAETERDAARRDAASARAERDKALEITRELEAERARLTTRLRQLEARNELLRADATGGRPGTDPRLRKLVSEREQLATHVRALAELLSSDKTAGDADVAAEPTGAVADNGAERLEALRARAVLDANEQAERELRRLRGGAPL